MSFTNYSEEEVLSWNDPNKSIWYCMRASDNCLPYNLKLHEEIILKTEDMKDIYNYCKLFSHTFDNNKYKLIEQIFLKLKPDIDCIFGMIFNIEYFRENCSKLEKILIECDVGGSYLLEICCNVDNSNKKAIIDRLIELDKIEKVKYILSKFEADGSNQELVNKYKELLMFL